MLLNEIEKLKKVITELLMEEFEAQGHKMTGKLVDDIEFDTSITKTAINIAGKMYPYGNVLNRGVKPGKVPFSGTGKRGGTSLYIKALQKYAKLKMNISDDKEALGVAFAIAHTQRKEGMPTFDSYQYSKTGQRMDWIDEALRKDRLSQSVFELSYNTLRYNVDTFVNKWNVEFNKN